MTFLQEITGLSRTAIISFLGVLALIDTMLIVLVKMRKPLLDNKYFDFHRKHGIIKISVVKVALVLYIAYALLVPTINSGKLVVPIFFYAFFILKLLFDYLRNRGTPTQPETSEGIYS